MARSIQHRYQDPLDVIWLECALRVGLRVDRAPDAYASTDGQGTLLLSDAAGMDADDSLSQMILHELCHALVQGRESFEWIDWGLDNEGSRDDVLEHACLRLQAALLEPLGLREVLGPTTDFRAYYDQLPRDPFEERDPSERESIVRGRLAFARRATRPWGTHLLESLEKTAQVVALTSSFAPSDSLYSAATPRAPLHRIGLPLHAEPTAGRRCGACGWASERGARGLACRVAGGRRVEGDDAACERFEEQLDCQACGACCREAYDVVVVARADPAAKLHLDLLMPTASGFDLVRNDGRCVALRGGHELATFQPAIARRDVPATEPSRVPRYIPGDSPFACTIYETRPKTCRDFTRGSQNCLDARRTVGLSR